MTLVHTVRPKLRPFLYSLFIFLTLFYFLSLCLGSVDFFHALLSKAGVSMGCRALSAFLMRMGYPGSLALVILSLLGFFFGSESALINWMDSSGSASGSASESWKNFLNLSEENATPETTSHPTQPNPEPEQGEVLVVTPISQAEIWDELPPEDEGASSTPPVVWPPENLSTAQKAQFEEVEAFLQKRLLRMLLQESKAIKVGWVSQGGSVCTN